MPRPRSAKAKYPRGSRRHPIRWIAAFLVIVVAIVGYLMLTHKAFRVKYVRIQGNEAIRSEEIVEKLGDMNQNIFLLDTGAIKDKLESLGGITYQSVERHLPNRITIHIKEVYVLGQLTVEDKVFWIDNEGQLLERGEGAFEPRKRLLDIETEKALPQIGGKLFSDERPVECLKQLHKSALAQKIQKVVFKKNDNIDIMIKGINVRFGQANDILQKLSTLEAVLKEIEAKGIQAVEIILNQGDNPIVVTAIQK